ncbi:hypothetical protein [Streptomyces sp. NPDC005302]
MILAAFFSVAMVGAICGLAAVEPRAVPPVAATTAFILTLAALAVAVCH